MFKYYRSIHIFAVLGALLVMNACADNTRDDSRLFQDLPNLGTNYQDYFRLIPSLADSKVIYYVPLDGGLLAENGLPRLSVRQLGESLRVSGAFKTGGYDRILNALRIELRNQGYILAPAPIKQAKADYLLAAQRLPNGRFDVRCDDTGAIHSCRIWDENSQGYRISSNDIRRFQATFPTSATVADRMFFNFDVDQNSYRDLVQDFLNSGLEWDSVFIAKVDWLLNIRRTRNQAHLMIDWRSLVNESRQMIRSCQGSCSEQELKLWFQGISASVVRGQQIDPAAVNFIFDHEIRPRLFVELLDRNSMQGVPAGERSFTLRIAPEIENAGDQNVTWELDAEETGISSQESLYRIECVKGSVDGPITWSSGSEFCPI